MLPRVVPNRMTTPPGDFSDEAERAVRAAVERYATELTARARGRTGAEVVLVRDVAAAVSELRADRSRDRTRIVSDWAKRAGFLFVGFAVMQFQAVSAQQPISGGGVAWLVADVAVATGLVTAGALLDRATLRSRGR